MIDGGCHIRIRKFLWDNLGQVPVQFPRLLPPPEMHLIFTEKMFGVRKFERFSVSTNIVQGRPDSLEKGLGQNSNLEGSGKGRRSSRPSRLPEALSLPQRVPLMAADCRPPTILISK